MLLFNTNMNLMDSKTITDINTKNNLENTLSDPSWMKNPTLHI